MKEFCRLLSSCKEADHPEDNMKALNFAVDNDRHKKVELEYPLRSIHIHRPIGKIMIVLIGECGTGKSTTLHNLFNDGNLYAVNKTRGVTEYSKLIACSHFKAHLSFVDTPGIFDTQEARHEANMDKLNKFREQHSAFRQIPGSTVYPNLVLITVKASDTRLDDQDSLFSQTLRAIDGTSLIDPSRMNMIVVATFSAQIATNAEDFAKEKRWIRYVISKVVHSVLGILDVNIVFIENKALKYNLRKHGNFDSFELPDGELTPLNLCEAICDHLKSCGDALGSLVTSRYFNENCEERKHAVAVENMNLIFKEPGEDFEKQANIAMEQFEVLDQERFCKANQYAGCGYSLRKECTSTGQIFATAFRSEIETVPEKYFNKMTFDTEREYITYRLEMYGMNRGMELRLCPDVSSLGKWEHDVNFEESKAYKDKIVISFVHHERLGTITSDERRFLVKELRTALDSLPNMRSIDWFCDFTMLTSGKMEQFYSFFDIWGTHYIKEVGVGGSMRVDCCIPSDFSHEDRTCLENTIENHISTEWKDDVDLESLVGDGYVKIKFSGGIPPKVTKLADLTHQMFVEWKESLKSHPIELKDTIKLQSYEGLIDDEGKKMSLREATLKYLKDSQYKRTLRNMNTNVYTQVFAAWGILAAQITVIMIAARVISRWKR